MHTKKDSGEYPLSFLVPVITSLISRTQLLNEETNVVIILNLVPNLSLPRTNSWNMNSKLLVAIFSPQHVQPLN